MNCVRLDEKDGKGRWISRSSAESYTDDALYDLYADPWELTNLIGMASIRHIVAEPRTRLIRRMRAAGEAEPRFIDAPAVPALQRQPEYHEPSLGV